MNVLRKIDNIMFYVEDLNASEKFYEDVLGLKKVWRDDKEQMIGFVFTESDSEIVIHNREDLPKMDYSFLVDNVEEFVEQFKSKGKIIKEPFEVRCGKFAVLEDLTGNILPIIDLSKFDNKPKYD